MNLKICKRQKRDVTTDNVRKHTCVVRSHQCYVAETETVVVGWVLDLPTHIIYEILSRLPMKTIYSCKCVCKTFLKIVKDPYFAELHLKAPNVDQNLIVQSVFLSEISLGYISDIENHSGSWRNLNILPFAPPGSHVSYSFGGSCNGLLLCMYHLPGNLSMFYVCNPILGEFVILPYNSDDKFHCGAIGFCTKTKLYKVIRFRLRKIGCEILTLGTNCWRIIENVPYPYHGGRFDSSLNGNLHWITDSTSNLNLICAFNLETEQPHYISPPSQMLKYTRKRISYLTVGALDGLFCIYYLLDKAQFEVCVMKEYGVVSSWTKKFTVDLKFNFLQQPKSIHPWKLFSNGDLLVNDSYGNLIYCSFRKDLFRELTAPPGRLASAVPLAPCFISLREIAGDMKVIQRNKSTREIKNFAYVDRNPAPLVWLDEDILRLRQAVFRNRSKTRIAWGRVAAEVGTHNLNQCKCKWHSLRWLKSN